MSRLTLFLLCLCGAWLPIPASSAAAEAASASAPVVLVFGDSLSAGYGLTTGPGWVDLLARRTEAYGFRVVNASVSGETSAGGLARLPRALAAHRPRIVVIELGANDGLRALPLEQMRSNIAGMIRLARQPGREVLLLGIRMPPNYGERYTSGFEQVYRDLARQYRVPLVPFLLKRVASDPSLMQGDGLHPNEAGQPLLLDNVWPALARLLDASRDRSPRRQGER